MSVTIKTAPRNDRTLCTGHDVEILHKGEKVSGVAAIDIRMRPGEIVTAELEIPVYDVSVVAEARWIAVNPGTGTVERVRRIEFADGTVWEAD